MKKSERRLDVYKRMLASFRRLHILVVGDVMLDEYVWGRATRISPEAPVPVVEIEKRTFNPGGAANTVSNILSMGARATLVGVVGNDSNGKILRGILREAGIQPGSLVVDAERPTTCKVRIVAHGQQVMRADHEITSPISDRIASRALNTIRKIISSADGIAVSDYNKGVVTPGFMSRLITMAKEHGKIMAADMKPDNASLFKGATIVTPNRSEASKMSGIEIVDKKSLELAGSTIRKELGVESVLITLGEEGMALFTSRGGMRMFPAVATQ
ncbi:MAG: bifunctional ADP-heptose synthase, partial [bacterium]